jgi:hypothetical protein
MPGFSYRNYNMVQGGMNSLSERLIATLDYEISNNEFIDTFVPEHLREMSRQIKHLFHLGWSVPSAVESSLTLSDNVDYRMHFSFVGAHAPVIPKQLLKPTGENAVMERIQAHMEKRVEMGKQIGAAVAAVKKLNELCGSEQQVRYFFPTVLLLLEHCIHDSDGKIMADKLRGAKTPRSLPSLPNWVREGLAVGAGIFTAASFLPEPTNRTREVRIELNQNSASFLFHGERISIL